MTCHEPEYCHCGLELHYTDKHVEYMIRKMIQELGPEVEVEVCGTTYLVPRHYIALHGLKAAEVPGLGFPEVRE